jgi:undecaprenyl-diphosphatase
MLFDLDQQLFLLLNQHNAYWLDELMFYLSTKWLAIPLYIFAAYLLHKKYPSNFWWILISFFVLIILSDQISGIFKHYFQRLRPCHEPELQGLVHLVKDYCGGKFGFYSSHASNTSGFVVLFIALIRNIKFTVLLIIWCALVGISRIYLAAHYPSDVLAGWLAGSILAALVYYILDRFVLNKNGAN